jgi:exodeoxyribonuclease VII small subunit
MSRVFFIEVLFAAPRLRLKVKSRCHAQNIDTAKHLTAKTGGVIAVGMSQEASELNFERALRALEDIVHRLESGEAPLDESIALYERGNQLRALCQQRLDAAKARIEAITLGPDGSPSGTTAFDAG